MSNVGVMIGSIIAPYLFLNDLRTVGATIVL